MIYLVIPIAVILIVVLAVRCKKQKQLIEEMQNKQKKTDGEHKSKTLEERFEALDPELQMMLLNNGQDPKSIRQRQQKAAQQRKEAERQKEKARQQRIWATQLAIGFGGQMLDKQREKEREEKKIRELQLEELERKKKDWHKR